MTLPAGWVWLENPWVPIALGVVIALIVHLTKATARPVINVATVGLATPVVSAEEDAGSAVLSVLAILVPMLIVLISPLVMWMIWWVFRRRQRRNGRPPKGSAVSSAHEELLESFSRRAASDSSSARVPADASSLANEDAPAGTSLMSSSADAATCFLCDSQRAWAAA